MRSDKALAQLLVHQARVRSLLADGTALVLAPPDEARQRVAPLRWQLTRALREYQLFKHGEVFDPLIASGAAATVRLARGMKERCTLIGDAFLAHGSKWGPRDLVGEWEGYRAESKAVLDGLFRHLDREEQEIATLLHDVARTRHPRADTAGGPSLGE